MKQLFILTLIFASCHLNSQSLYIGTNHQEQYSFLFKSKNEIQVISVDTLITIDIEKLKIKDKTHIDSILLKIQFEQIVINDELYFTERNGGIVYKLLGDSLKRIDNSYSHKMTINSTLFEYNDTIFRYGGYGFWSQRNFFIYFEESSGEWEMIPPINSKILPEGTRNAIVKVIGNDFYVFGGDKLNPFNPHISTKNNKLWKFNIREKRWDLVGRIRTDFSSMVKYIPWRDKYILMDNYTDKTYVLDIKNNSIKTYIKTNLQFKLNHFLDPIFHNGTFYCFITTNSVGEVQLTTRGEDEFFGRLLKEEKLYKDYTTLWLLTKIFFILLVFGIVLYFYRRNLKRRNLIIVSPKEIIHKKRIIPFDMKSIQILNLLLNSEKEVSFGEIMNVCENKDLDYSHNTRVINKMIDQLNFKISSLLRIDETSIQVKKSEKDKRVKIYTIDKNLFFVKK